MKREAFTLIEALIAVVIIGLAIASLVAANIAFTAANSAGANLSTAEFLAEQVRELLAPLPVIDPQAGAATFGAEEASLAQYDDLDDFDNKTFSPPINADRLSLGNFTAFSQQVAVQNVSPTNFDQVVPDHGSNFVRVTVTVSHNSEKLIQTSWIRARY